MDISGSLGTIILCDTCINVHGAERSESGLCIHEYRYNLCAGLLAAKYVLNEVINNQHIYAVCLIVSGVLIYNI